MILQSTIYLTVKKPVNRQTWAKNRQQRLCNKCGRKLDKFDEQQGFTYKRQLGYGSSYDGEMVDFQLCSACIDNLLAECEVNPFIS